MINKLKELMKNKWQGVPLYHMEEEFEIKQKVNNKLKPTQLGIEIKIDEKLDQKANYYFVYTLDLKDKKIENKVDFMKPINIVLDLERAIKTVDKRRLDLVLFRKRLVLAFNSLDVVVERFFPIRIKALAK
jgi:hypothetical protein